ncbi:hypothetical protein B9Z55_020174 [Caenorhabditis nigoni]|uniref:Uncharacterized protein n=1 Tax=Caenorhabditis nigoni TaxID=1611254 RepID=A0A2G5TLK6_9PELO|nr:hypothetical protein B9Z55_020174 [Caenorhabditis nigoni]
MEYGKNDDNRDWNRSGVDWMVMRTTDSDGSGWDKDGDGDWTTTTTMFGISEKGWQMMSIRKARYHDVWIGMMR